MNTFAYLIYFLITYIIVNLYLFFRGRRISRQKAREMNLATLGEAPHSSK